MPLEAKGEINAIQRENARAGTSAWRLTSPALKREIEGYASLTSVIRGAGDRVLYPHSERVPIASLSTVWAGTVAPAREGCMVL